MGSAKEGVPLAEDAYEIAASYGYATLAKQIESILDCVCTVAGVTRKK